MAATAFDHLLVPVASMEDAKRSCEVLTEHLDSGVEQLTVVHVIEQADGYIDPTSPEALEEEAERLFATVEACFENGPEVTRELRYGTDAVEEIIATADDLDVSAIGFSPRPKGRLERLLTENASYRLVTESHHPVVAFSRDEGD